MTTLPVGSRVVIGPAYEMATRARTRRDEWTDVEGTILRFEGTDAIVETDRTEVAINVERLEMAPAAAAALGALATRANEAASQSRRAGAPRLTATSDRDTLIAWLQWNDPNGCHTDELAAVEGFDPMDLPTAWDSLAAMLADDTIIDAPPCAHAGRVCAAHRAKGATFSDPCKA